MIYTDIKYIFDESINSAGQSKRTERFCFTGNYKFSDGRTIMIYKCCPSNAEMIREVWNHLDYSEKTELMAEVLGAK